MLHYLYILYYSVYAFIHTHLFTTVFGVSVESLDGKVTFFSGSGSHRCIVRSHHNTKKTVVSSHFLPHQEQRFPEVTRHRV